MPFTTQPFHKKALHFALFPTPMVFHCNVLNCVALYIPCITTYTSGSFHMIFKIIYKQLLRTDITWVTW